MTKSVITSKQPMADWKHIIECAGQKKKHNHTKKQQNDELMMFFSCFSYCGHDETSSYLGVWDKVVCLSFPVGYSLTL